MCGAYGTPSFSTAANRRVVIGLGWVSPVLLVPPPPAHAASSTHPATATPRGQWLIQNLDAVVDVIGRWWANPRLAASWPVRFHRAAEVRLTATVLIGRPRRRAPHRVAAQQ